MRWFKHYADASDDSFVEGLEDKFGLEGYARWWKMLEIIARSMDKTDGCSASHSWVKWQSFLKGKRNKLETFLEHCQNENKITFKLNGNILEIKCPNLLKLKDEYNSKSGHSPDRDRDTVPTPKTEQTTTDRVVYNKSLLDSPRGVNVDKSVDKFEELKELENKNNLDLFVCLSVVSELLGRKLHRREQEHISEWVVKYPMQEALELFDVELKKYRGKNSGGSPPATYFTPIFRNRFPEGLRQIGVA